MTAEVAVLEPTDEFKRELVGFISTPARKVKEIASDVVHSAVKLEVDDHVTIECRRDIQAWNFGL